jgi:FSR family fosmidomycin resistance protein-like MFS transporter
MKPDTLEKPASILSYGLLVMTVTHTLTHAFGQMHTTLFPVLREEFSLSYQQLGLIAAIPPLCQSLLSIPTGLLSDRFGSKKMIIVSMVVACAGSLLASATQSPLMFIVAVSLLYINTTIYHPASYSYTTRLFRLRDRSKALGIHGAGGTFGMSIGPLSLAILMGYFAFGWRQVYLFWFVPLLIGILVVFLIRSEPRDDVEVRPDPNTPQVQATKLLTTSLALFLVFGGIRMVAGGMTNSFLSVYLVGSRGWDQTFTFTIIGSSSLMGIVAAPLGGFLADRFGEKRWILMVLAVSYMCFGLAFAFPGTLAFVFMYLSHGFFNFLAMAANSALVAKLSPGRQRGLGYALFFLPGSIMGAVAPMMAAYIAEAFSLYSVFMTSLAAYVVGLLVLHFGVKVD